MTNESTEDNEIDTVEYVCKVNREVLYGRMASQINKKLNESVQALQHGITDPLAFSFPSNEIARHFYNQLEAHGWCATLDQDNDLVRIDVVSSLDQAMKDKDDEDDDDIGDSGFFADEVISLH